MNLDLNALWETLTSTLTHWAEAGAAHVPNLLVAIVLGLVFHWAAKGAKKVVRKALGRTHTQETVRQLLGKLAQVAADA